MTTNSGKVMLVQRGWLNVKNKRNHLKRLRSKAKIQSAKEAAAALEISTSMMYQMEEGCKKPSVISHQNV
jgi:flagellin-like hook-associated protein FlgL